MMMLSSSEEKEYILPVLDAVVDAVSRLPHTEHCWSDDQDTVHVWLKDDEKNFESRFDLRIEYA
jgi:hypothetical protein